MKQRAMIFGNVPKLPMKWATVVIPFFLSCLMSGIISFINMIRNLGWIDGFFALWFNNWMISWAFAFPVVLFVLPMVRKFASLIVDMSALQPPK
ncbi:hypothetical protein KAM398_17440 [Acinetobacter sp. KAM398]|uniref:DUF2798 domain-containing protein n=1 Tax=unclassified Acinetobacter TaxID=196816 RepID=UPI001F27A835|nr:MULTISPECIES: DUF2798 domain-containing protein [unclassified Acinetobacter]GJC31802.1 hypothetical protein KAM392_17810 [Acinetobacter sp. KAM392]GJC34574.1 hypothetical protein KAM393_17430 [Acinetobacter sp. KAM393]GJC37432.1 hypothetical protein KAM394_17720 [Acinetobacter sp. KAM394]GJC40259.1 hypothetical protein KAM395_17800 [Acinetobacter sp. KAM395]GJC43043.1 hypothetical protein KAM396_17400 [Acinetobacter sp. KAM396]